MTLIGSESQSTLLRDYPLAEEWSNEVKVNCTCDSEVHKEGAKAVVGTLEFTEEFS